MAQEGRSILSMIFRNFIKSFRIRQITGNLIGKDFIGNQYFEIPADPQGGKRKATRWFEPAEKENFEQEIPAEWEAWLRARRASPPTEDEVVKNFAIMQMKKKNALEITTRDSLARNNSSEVSKAEKGMESFPRYDEYERMPGKKETKN